MQQNPATKVLGQGFIATEGHEIQVVKPKQSEAWQQRANHFTGINFSKTSENG
jgi:hypothetical protein